MAGFMYAKEAEKQIKPMADAPKPTSSMCIKSLRVICLTSLYMEKRVGDSTNRFTRCSQVINTIMGKLAKAGFLKNKSVLRKIPQKATKITGKLIFIACFYLLPKLPDFFLRLYLHTVLCLRHELKIPCRDNGEDK